MATRIKHKRSSVSGRVPEPENLSAGELAINTADGKIYTLKDDNTVSDLTSKIFKNDTKVEVGDELNGSGTIINEVDGLERLTINNISSTFTNNVILDNNKNLTFNESVFSGTNKISIRSPSAITTDYTLTLPPDSGVAGQILTTDGFGVTSFIAPDSLAGNRIYVSKKFGNDRNDAVNSPVSTLKRALQIASDTLYSPLIEPSSTARDTETLIKANKQWIQFETIAYLDATYAELNFDTQICSRDVGLVVDGQSYDIVLGSNYNARKAAYTYYNATASEVISSQLALTLDGLGYALDQMLVSVSTDATAVSRLTANKAIILDVLENGVANLPSLSLPNPAGISTGLANAKTLLLANIEFIQEEVVGYINDTYPALTYDEDKCKRDTAYIVESIAYDLIYGSNVESIDSGLKYYDGVGNTEILQVAGQEVETEAGINYAKYLAQQIVLNLDPETSYQLSVTQTKDVGNPGDTTAKTQIGVLFDIVTEILSEGPAATPELIYPDLGAYSVGLRTASTNLRLDKFDIQVATIDYLVSTYGGFTYNRSKCRRDIGYIVDSVVFDLIYGGNSKAVYSGKSYNYAVASVVKNDQLPETLDGIEFAKFLTQKVMANTAPEAGDYSLTSLASYQSTFSQIIDTDLSPDSTSIAKIEDGFDIITDILFNGDEAAPEEIYPQYITNPTTILVATGDYTEQNPVIVPDGVSIIGDNLRGVIIRPANAGVDMFRVRNASYLYGFTFRDQIDINKAPSFTYDYCVAFDDINDTGVSRGDYPGLPASKPAITQSPYVQNCTILSFLGGNGVLVDGDKIVDPNVPNIAAEVENPVNLADGIPQQGKSMVANAFTHISFGGTGWRLINDAYAQLVSCFQIFCLNGAYTQSGGYLSITNSATNFGLFALRSSGYSRRAFTFDRGIIAATGVFQGLQTITTLGTRRPPVEQFVSRFRDATGTIDQSSLFLNTTTVVSINGFSSANPTTDTFTVSSHGLTTGSAVTYFTDSSLPIVGLNDEQTYYVQVIDGDNFQLYFDDSLSSIVNITGVGADATQRLVVDPEEFFVEAVVSSHNTYQTLSLTAGSYNFIPGSLITGTTGIYSNSAYVYSYDDDTNTLVVSVNEVLVGSTVTRVLFEPGSIIAADQETPTPNTNITVTSVSSRNDLYTGVSTLQSTISGNSIQNILQLPGRVIWFHRPSICNSSAHTWEYAGSGTDYNALPENGGEARTEYEQVSDLPGRVYSSGTDELGNFKVGDFIKAENKTGNITFTNTVTVGELNALKLSLSDVEITNISTDVNLGDDEPGGASNGSLVTQLAIRSFLENRLGDFIDKNVSTNAVPGGIVQLNSSGILNQELIPSSRNFTSVILQGFYERFNITDNIPPTSLVIGDIVTEEYQFRLITISANITAEQGEIITQANSGATGILVRPATNTNLIRLSVLSGTFTTNSSDTLSGSINGDFAPVYMTDIGEEEPGAENLVIVDDTISQALVLYDAPDSSDYDFTVSNQVSASINTAFGTITSYVAGVMTSVNNIFFTGGSGYIPLSSTETYNNVPFVTLTGVGSGALADITISNGSVSNVDIIRGGSGYEVGNTVTVNSSDVGGSGSGFVIAVNDIEKRLYVNLDTNVKFIGNITNNDFITDNNAPSTNVPDTSDYDLISFDASDQGAGGDVDTLSSIIYYPDHGFLNGDIVLYNSSPNIAIGALTNNREYYVIKVDDNNISLAANYTLNKITFTASSTGNHVLTRRPVAVEKDSIVIPNHGYNTGDPLQYIINSGAGPGGLVNYQKYFVGSVGPNSFTLHLIRADAFSSISGLVQSPVNISDIGINGNITFTLQNVKVIDTFNTSSQSLDAYSTLTTANIDASNIVSGVVDPTRLATSGTANTETFLRGDSIWSPAVSSVRENSGSPMNFQGSFTTVDGIPRFYGDVRIDVDKVDDTLGNPNFTNLGVVSLYKFQFQADGDTGEVLIKDGTVDAGQLGGQLPSYYLTPSNLLTEVPVNKGGTGLQTVLNGALLHGSGGSNDLTVLAIGNENTVLTSTGSVPTWSTSLALDGDIAVNGGDITSTATTFNLLATPTTINIGAAGTNVNIGATTGITTIRNDAVIEGDLRINGTTVIINSTQISVDEPLFNIGGQVIRGTYSQSSGSSIITITVDNHGLIPGANIYVDFTTTSGSTRTDGTFSVVSTPNSNQFTISNVNTLSSAGTVIVYTQTTDDNKDRGVTFQYVSGTARQGFFGWDDSVQAFTIVPQADSTGDVISGTRGAIAAEEYAAFDGANEISRTSAARVTGVSSASVSVVDSFEISQYRSAKFLVQVTSTSGANSGQHTASEVLMIHNGTTCFLTQYAIIRTGTSDLVTLSCDISGTTARLRAQSLSTNVCTVKVTRISTTV